MLQSLLKCFSDRFYLKIEFCYRHAVLCCQSGRNCTGMLYEWLGGSMSDFDKRRRSCCLICYVN